MAQPTVHDVILILRDLLGPRRPLLERTNTGQTYLPLFETRQGEFEALPRALTSELPLAEELANTDDLHDGFGSATWFLTEAYLRLPGVDPELREAALRIRKTFIQNLGELQRPYSVEAHAAIERKDDLDGAKADLKRFPVVGGTLHNWVGAFLNHGEQLDQLLSQRGDATATTPEGRRKAAMLRTGTIGLLGRARSALADEVSANAKLPRDLEGKVFGYFDEIARMRASQGRTPKVPPSNPPAGGGPTG